MGLIILGVVLWSAIHLLKRLAPDLRARLEEMGEGPAKGIVAGTLVLSIILMVIGYRGHGTDALYVLPDWTRHLNNLLIWIAFMLLGLRGSTGRFGTALRHPMLVAFIIWAAAHLLVNGTAADIALFGGLLIWAVVEIFAINAREGAWVRPENTGAPEWRRFAISTGIFVAIGVVHGLIGPWPFGG